MAWTTPGTAVAGDVLTAAFWNTNVRDNLNDHETRLLLAPQVIQTVSLSGTGTISFSSIPQTYTHLEVLINARSSAAAVVEAASLRFNGDTGANYRWTVVQIQNTTVSGVSSVTGTGIEVFVFPGSTSGAGIFGAGRAVIPFYRSNRVKSITGEGSSVIETTTNSFHRHGSGYWNNTAAITSLSINISLLSGSTATLIGIP